MAAILRTKSSTYSTRTLAEFTSIMFIATYLETFIATYPEYFADVQRTYQQKFDVLTAKIKKLDPTQTKNVFHY